MSTFTRRTKPIALAMLAGTWLAATTVYGLDDGQQIGSIVGAGNFANGSTAYASQFQALNDIGASMARINMYPNYYYAGDAPTPERLDALMLQAYEYGITPMLLFEYYGSYAGQGTPLGGYAKWYDIGRDFAERFRPNGTWGQEQGIADWGITVYAAMNEPDVENLIPKADYHDALEGLADGIHSVDPALKAIPGGFARQNSHSDYTLRGYGPAIADLWNDGKLDGIDLHTYFDYQYAPMEGMYKFSAQSNFDSIKSVSGITADIHFYTSEFNYKKRGVTEEEAAKGFLTAFWDSVGVVKNDGHTSAARLAFPWSLFKSQAADPLYGLNTSLTPWTPTERGQTLERALAAAQGMSLVAADPKQSGEYVLEGAGKKMWVWQNRPYWTNHPGTTYTVTGIPPGALRLEVIGWDGVRQTLPLCGQTGYTVTGLAENETYMIVAYEEPDSP